VITRTGELLNNEARIETVTYCNSNCSICARDKFTRPKMIMPYYLFAKLLPRLKIMGVEVITLYGFGEPLLDNMISERVRLCRNLGFDTFLTTNASLLSHTMTSRLLYAGLSHIRFSCHGIDKASYEKVHCGLDFESVMDNINQFLLLNEKSGNKCKTSVSVIPMNGESIDAIVDFWEPHVDWLEIWRPHNWSGAKTYRKLEVSRPTCGRPFSGPLQINADGTIMVCCFDYDGQMTLGDTKKNTILDILKSDRLKYIQNKHLNQDYSGLPCETCDQLNLKDEPLLYSNRDKSREKNVSSTTKTKTGGVRNGINPN